VRVRSDSDWSNLNEEGKRASATFSIVLSSQLNKVARDRIFVEGRDFVGRALET